MKKAILIVLSVLYLSSCEIVKGVRVSAAQRKIERIENKYPQLFDADTIYTIRKDTLLIETPSYYLDTIIIPSDTMTIENERIKTVIIRLPSDTTYKVQTLVKTLKIPFERIDTIYTIKEKIKLQREVKKVIPIWFVLVSVLLFILLLITYIRYLNSNE